MRARRHAYASSHIQLESKGFAQCDCIHCRTYIISHSLKKKRLSTPVASLLAMTDNYLIRGLIIKSCILVKSTNSTVLPSSYSVMCMLGRRSTHKSRSTWQWSSRQSENHVWGPYGLRESRWTLLRGDCKGWISSWKYAVGFNLLLFSFFTLSFPTGRGSSSDIVQLTLTWSVLFPIPYFCLLLLSHALPFSFSPTTHTHVHTHILSLPPYLLFPAPTILWMNWNATQQASIHAHCDHLSGYKPFHRASILSISSTKWSLPCSYSLQFESSAWQDASWKLSLSKKEKEKTIKTK